VYNDKKAAAADTLQYEQTQIASQTPSSSEGRASEKTATGSMTKPLEIASVGSEQINPPSGFKYMKRSKRVITSFLVAVVTGAMAVYNTVNRNDTDYQIHPVVSIFASIIPSVIVGFAYYWFTGWLIGRRQRNMEQGRKANTLLPWVALIAFVAGILLWFNRYSYTEMKIGDVVLPVRTSRINGESEVFMMGQWKEIGGNSNPSDSSRSGKTVALPQDELAKLQGQASTTSFWDSSEHYILQCSIYNGSSYSVSEVKVQLQVEATSSLPALTREYRVLPQNGNSLPTLTSGTFQAETGLNLQNIKWTWAIISATGTK
jgi:hypothetical protein